MRSTLARSSVRLITRRAATNNTTRSTQALDITRSAIVPITRRTFASDTSNEEWIPPPPRVIVDKTDNSEVSVAEVSQQERQQQQLFKQQERIESLREQEEALLQLSEEEMKTLSDDDILARVEKVLAMEEALEEQMFQEELAREESLTTAAAATDNHPTDWLQTRRAALGKSQQDEQSAIPVRLGELLTAEEIEALLQSRGGTNLVTILDDEDQPRMGGAHGMILCTARGSDESDDLASSGSMVTNPFLINTLARLLIDHLKERQLDVLGAHMGTNHLSPRGAATSAAQSSQSTWHVVDCGNFIVHILDAHTRASLKLEALWSGKDPLWRLNFLDDDAVEEYCARNPVPASYNGGSATTAPSSQWDPSVIRRLERNQYAAVPAKHRPVIPTATKRRDRQAGRRRKREQRQQSRRQQQGQY